MVERAGSLPVDNFGVLVVTPVSSSGLCGIEDIDLIADLRAQLIGDLVTQRPHIGVFGVLRSQRVEPGEHLVERSAQSGSQVVADVSKHRGELK